LSHAITELPTESPRPATGLAALICVVGELRCALPLGQVVETMRPLPVESVASSSRFVMGLAIIRGAPVPVIDLGSLLGARTCTTRFVTVSAEGRTLALSVDEILGVREIPAGVLKGLPPLLHDASTGAVAAIGASDGALLVVLRAARILSEDVWNEITRKYEV
jgi:purine-binding chemotaxis protein CheW